MKYITIFLMIVIIWMVYSIGNLQTAVNQIESHERVTAIHYNNYDVVAKGPVYLPDDVMGVK